MPCLVISLGGLLFSEGNGGEVDLGERGGMCGGLGGEDRWETAVGM